MIRSRDIIEVIGDVVAEAKKRCTLTVRNVQGTAWEIPCPPINFVFGDAQYIKDRLDELSLTEAGNEAKLPMIALQCPVNEKRTSADYYTEAKVNILIACSTRQQWSNEERLTNSFINILRPIYRAFLEALKADGRIDFGYNERIRHEYSENYSYGRYGAYAPDGKAVSESIDAINIANLELKITKPSCR